MSRFWLLGLALVFSFGCAVEQQTSVIESTGAWIMAPDSKSMLDPQTSGLFFDKDKLYTLADGSADINQQQKLHIIDTTSAKLTNALPIVQFSQIVTNSCFFPYLAQQPDYEAMVKHPELDNHWIWVTEDATRGEPLSEDCKVKYADSGSTEYPTLLVLIRQLESNLSVVGVRPLKFAMSDKIGNHPNDGIEGLAVTRDGQLLMGLEKDEKGSARVFTTTLTKTMFESTDFLNVEDAGLEIPDPSSGNHPINGMDIVYTTLNQGYLIAAARNDNELWIIDLNKQQPTRRINIRFYAPAAIPSCPVPYLMDNASIEGVAVAYDTLLLINDPWKQNYLKNVKCNDDRVNYERYSPLLFTIPLTSLGL